ncbi:orotate phosphoribosyltransferase [Methanothermobacter tenebrarum]|uniref:orotate phosphoribosyltransferase n=1 Tax=Methanothermobacter tenebrarum TaxID=680118 RepID=UPI0020BFB528|nr:orotate phosphoribosyltransferase [Methanothermobacter tenebrarum]MDD3454596.1 orotate phosphoribosyltransferase [Methanobacteriales archaeon]MDI6882548.1 orotate phosphoribosyltransferase [Methanothermobacter sp.]
MLKLEVRGLCSLCGKVAFLHTCRLCGALVCSDCYVPELGVCRICAGKLRRRNLKGAF